MQHATGTIREERQLGSGATRLAAGAGIVGVIGLAAGALFGYQAHDWGVFFRSYLLNYCFVLTLALGALFFVMLQHLTRAGWSVAVRRLAELVTGTLPVLAVLFIPLVVPALLGLADVYPWANAERVAHDELLQHKRPFLNPPFWLVRCAGYFVIWTLLARFFFRTSQAQDTSGDVGLTERMQWWSAPGMLLYGVTVTFFSVDVLMSLNPTWYSTIWGVYFFSGSLVGFFSLLAIMRYCVQRSGRLTRAITTEHYHDLGKLVFAFVVFWAYIAFSQYMLIWYANIPEETAWFHPRQGDTWWRGVSLLLLGGHFVAPFLALISRYLKRRPLALVLAAVWLLAMHWLDLYYIVTPRPQGTPQPASPLHASDLALLVGMTGIFTWALVRPMARVTLIPQRDPRLPESLAFENV